MEKIYNIYKGKEAVYQDGTVGTICGFTDSELLMAIKTKPIYSFRKFGRKDHFVEEQYRGEEYRYCYLLESTAEKQHPCETKKNSY